jgi:hypothetical protein
MTKAISTESNVTVEKISFLSNNIKVVGNLYYPESNVNGASPFSAIIVGHPGSGVKEQAAGLYAKHLAERGFITLVFDCAYQGESEGTPRGLEYPAQRVEDFKSAVSFLTTVKEVAPNKIGVLGVCASGGYSLAAASTDHRIKAIATVSAVDIGQQFRKGADGKQDPAVLQNMLDLAAADRTAVANGKEQGYFPLFPENEEQAKTMGQHTFEGWEYYCTDRAQHPRSAKVFAWSSIDRMAEFSASDFVDLISPRPVLMIAGTEAVTLWITEEAYNKANEPKEKFLIDGASHVALYDKEEYVSQAFNKLDEFFRKNLVSF